MTAAHFPKIIIIISRCEKGSSVARATPSLSCIHRFSNETRQRNDGNKCTAILLSVRETTSHNKPFSLKNGVGLQKYHVKWISVADTVSY